MMLEVYASKTLLMDNTHSHKRLLKALPWAGKSLGMFLGHGLSLSLYCTCIFSWEVWISGIKRDGTCDSLSYILVKLQCILISDTLTYTNYFNYFYRIQLNKHNLTFVDFRENTSSAKLVHYAVPGYSDSKAISPAFLGFPAFLCIFIQIRASS